MGGCSLISLIFIQQHPLGAGWVTVQPCSPSSKTIPVLLPCPAWVCLFLFVFPPPFFFIVAGSESTSRQGSPEGLELCPLTGKHLCWAGSPSRELLLLCRLV